MICQQECEKNMVRETAKQRRESVVTQIALDAYPERLMDALYRASEHDATIKVTKDHKFMVTYIDGWNDNQHIYLTPTVDTHLGMFPLNELIRVLDYKDVEVAEANRKREVRKNAIAKLTDEERVELGIGNY